MFAQKMILLIDDDQEEFHILNHALQVAGLPHSCIWANGIERATQLLCEVLPDYIFIDYNMPKENGLACLEKIRKIKAIQDVPVVFYSNSIDETTRLQARERGASFCMEKPNSLSKLVANLIDIMGEGKLLHSC